MILAFSVYAYLAMLLAHRIICLPLPVLLVRKFFASLSRDFFKSQQRKMMNMLRQNSRKNCFRASNHLSVLLTGKLCVKVSNPRIGIIRFISGSLRVWEPQRDSLILIHRTSRYCLSQHMKQQLKIHYSTGTFEDGSSVPMPFPPLICASAFCNAACGHSCKKDTALDRQRSSTRYRPARLV